MSAYYNEFDPFAADWLRRLIFCGVIADGEVDERDIRDVSPDDLRPFTQHHFFAGIGVWSYALRQAGWPDDRPVRTASCPCQPFSSAGRGGGFADERHLWPACFHLLRELGPGPVFGEQVASKDGLAWLDLVQSDLEGEDYAFAALDLCAAGFGAPHIRQRLFWVAHPGGGGGRRDAGAVPGAQAAGGGERRQARNLADQPEPDGDADRRGALVDAAGEQAGLPGRAREPGGAPGGLADTAGGQPPSRASEPHGRPPLEPDGYRDAGELGHHHPGLALGSLADDRRGALRLEGAPAGAPGPVNGPWGDAEWIWCVDGKWRPAQPGAFPLAHGAPARVGRLRGYGNAIVAPVAQAFIEEVMNLIPGEG